MDLELAKEQLLKHSKSKANGVFPIRANLTAKMTNPICGDSVEFRIYMNKEVLEEVGHKAVACAICSASASIVSQHVLGQTFSDILKHSEIFEQEILMDTARPWPKELSAFSCFEHLRVNPARRMCALLPWIALRSAKAIS